MSQQSYALKAERREKVGKGAARELRRNGYVPAVIYGDKKDPLAITLSRKEVTMQLHAGGFMTTLAMIEVDGEKHQVLAKDYQTDPVRDFVTHVDFLRIGKGTRVVVEIPVHFLNEEESPGLKRGGVINIVRHEVEVECPATAIPDAFEVDLTGLDIGDSIHISNITLPDGVTPTITDRDFTVATIAAPAALTAEEDAGETEGEAEGGAEAGVGEAEEEAGGEE